MRQDPPPPSASPEPDAARVEAAEPGALYRPCVGIALFNRDGLVFVGRRRGTGGDGSGADAWRAHAWQMPQGGVDPGEAPSQAALRELHEETNVRPGSVRPLGRTQGWLRYDLPPEALKRSWKGRYRGQAQQWFAFGFTGGDDEIDVAHPAGDAHGAEFDAWRWEDLARTPELIVPFKRAVYERVAAEFSRFRAWHAAP